MAMLPLFSRPGGRGHRFDAARCPLPSGLPRLSGLGQNLQDAVTHGHAWISLGIFPQVGDRIAGDGAGVYLSRCSTDLKSLNPSARRRAEGIFVFRSGTWRLLPAAIAAAAGSQSPSPGDPENPVLRARGRRYDDAPGLGPGGGASGRAPPIGEGDGVMTSAARFARFPALAAIDH